MTFLRNRIFILLASLLVLGGYSHQVVASCGDPVQQSAKHSPGRAHNAPSKHSSTDNCHCLCHKVFSNAASLAVKAPVQLLQRQDAWLVRGEYAPLSEPAGIDHPPQLS